MDVVLIGAGGHSRVIRDMVLATKDQEHALRFVAVLDDKYHELKWEDGIYTGPISAAPTLIREYNHCQFLVAIGDNKVRRQIVERLDITEDHYATLIHKTALVSPSAVIEAGTVIMARAVIQASAYIGRHVIVNTGAIVEHDTILADYVHAAPGTIFTGAVRAGKGAMVGAGASVIPGITIGEWSLIGAGATVTNDLPPYCTAVGTPARAIRVEDRYLAQA